MRKKLTGLVTAIAILSVAVFVTDSEVAYAQAAASYDYEYDSVNMYWDEGLSFSFTNLTATAEYVWTIQELDASGNLVDVITSRAFTGAVSTVITFNNHEFPENRFIPFRVVDNFNNILSWHFLAPFPESEWLASNGNTSEANKQSVGAREITSTCVPPPYNDVLINGWHHTGLACSIYTETGSYTLLHYRSGDLTSGERIIFDAISPVNNGMLDIEIDELIDFNTFGQVTAFFAGATQRDKYVVLNTSGESLPFVNTAAANLSFTSGDNPMRASFDPGAYTCSRVDSVATWISDCESVFLVGNDPNHHEFDLRFERSEVPPGSIDVRNTQTMIFGGHTSEIWNAYSDQYQFIDSEVGTVSTELFDFTTSSEVEYLVDIDETNIGDTATGTWQIIPGALNTGLATPSEMFFWGVNSLGIRPTYSIIEATEFGANLDVLLSFLGLDTEAGQFMFFIAIFLIGSGVFWWFKLPPFVFSLWYAVSGGLIVGSGMGTSLFNIMYLATVVPVMWAGFTMQRRRSDMEF